MLARGGRAFMEETRMEGPICRQVERRARRLKDMLEALDVDEVSLVRLERGAAYERARTNCLNCAAAGSCLAWLAYPSESKGPPEFCPNRDLFERCRRPA